jgi:hypothetical protein
MIRKNGLVHDEETKGGGAPERRCTIYDIGRRNGTAKEDGTSRAA